MQSSFLDSTSSFSYKNTSSLSLGRKETNIERRKAVDRSHAQCSGNQGMNECTTFFSLRDRTLSYCKAKCDKIVAGLQDNWVKVSLDKFDLSKIS